MKIIAKSGNTCRLRFRIEGLSIACGALWEHPPSAEDVAQADAVTMVFIAPWLAPTAQVSSVIGPAGNEKSQDEIMDRFLKSDQN
jgi:hypothetical protein